MRRGMFALVVAVILIIGGYFALQIITTGADNALPVRVQTDNPEASTSAVTPQQAVYYVIFCLVSVGLLVFIGGGLAFFIRTLDQQIARNKD